MKCPNHLRTEVAGYCCVCGTFFCESCLTRHEGQIYCPRHYKPIAQKLEQARKHEEVRKRHGRHNLVVRFADGRVEYGISLTLNPRESGFTLQCVDKHGAALERALKIRFAELKAVFNVKAFDGKFDKTQAFQAYAPGGSKVYVKFKDGEVIEGSTLHAYNPDDVRFYLIPEDPESNNINVLVEAAAVERVYTSEEYKALKRQEAEAKELAALAVATPVPESTELGQEESMGDFYFETKGYATAMEQYRLALEKHPQSARIKRKIVVSALNVGIQHIKKREYPQALVHMEKALEYDPGNIHAKKKAKQLRHVIEKTQRRMQAYARRSDSRSRSADKNGNDESRQDATGF